VFRKDAVILREAGGTMIVVSNRRGATKSVVAAGRIITESDTSPPAGKGAGFRLHELFEAALASCTATTLRMFADAQGLALAAVTVSVEVDRSHGLETVLSTTIEFEGALSESERRLLLKAARSCPVRKTLSKRLRFTHAEALRLPERFNSTPAAGRSKE
jgi:putative redox protein